MKKILNETQVRYNKAQPEHSEYHGCEICEVLCSLDQHQRKPEEKMIL